MAKVSRRRWLGSAAGLAAAMLAGPQGAARAAGIDFERSREPIRQGLRYLADSQNEAGEFTQSAYGPEPAICALAGLAFMASGHTPQRGKYGRQVSRCVDYLLAHASDSGLIALPETATRGPMYGHGFATLFLSEAYGMSQRRDLREKLSRAVKLIVDAQNDEGGWRYQPHSRDADISVTVCQVMALRSARNAGLFVPKRTIDRAIDYVKRSQNPDGGFSYMLRERGPSDFGRTAAGIVALNSAGLYEGSEIQQGLKYLRQWIPGRENGRSAHYFYYGHYYAVQAMHRAGGDDWLQWYPAIQKALLNRKTRSGFWRDVHGPEYATAMACIILQTPNSLLPIFQK